ncbi:MAG: hypothetical protein U9R75_01970 [Candidatus Thermoplasmatota archaeon]|nr:hypothetical protein [Candidatus Thermoplasmatota archaeon]
MDREEGNSSLSRPQEVRKQHVILDANALLSPFQNGFNLDLELERSIPGVIPVVPSSVIRELRVPSKAGKWQIKAALKLAEKYLILDIKGKGDAPIFNLSVNNGWMVMTQDRRLRNKLLSRGIHVLILRGKGHLEVISP